MLVRRPQVLPEREDVDVDVAQLAHRLQHLGNLLAHAEDQSRFRGDLRRYPLRDAEDLEHAFVAAAGTTAFEEPRHRLGVVVVDLGGGVEHGADRLLAPLEIGDEHLDGAVGELRVDLADGLGEDVGAEVGEIVAVDRGDHRVLEIELGDCRGDAGRLLDVVRGRASVRDRAVGAVTRADVAEDHEGGGAMLPALADVGAVGLGAHGMQPKVLHQLLHAEIVRTAGGPYFQPRRLALGERGGSVSAHDLVERIVHAPLVANCGARGCRTRHAQAICSTCIVIVTLTGYQNIAGYRDSAKRSIANGDTSYALGAPTARAPIASPVIGARRIPFRPWPQA